MLGHVFISHSHSDSDRANMLVNALEARGLKCWIAPRDIPPGGSYAEAILTAIEKSRGFVLVYSKHTNASGHVLREVERAIKFERNIIPIRFDDTELSRSLDYLLATVHWLSLASQPLRQAVNRAADQIAATLNSESPIPAPSVVSGNPASTTHSSSVRWAMWIAVLFAAISAVVVILFLTRPSARKTTVATTQLSSVTPTSTPSVASPADFVQNFVKSLSLNNSTEQVANYADQVTYYDAGKVSKGTVKQDLEHDIKTWPDRVYSIHDKPKIAEIAPNRFKADFPIAYSLTNAKGVSSGILQMHLQFESRDGAFRIVEIQKKAILAERKR